MNKVISLAILLSAMALFSSATLQAQKQCKVRVTWKYLNVEEGFDHQNKTVVYIDGVEVATSDVFVETKPGKMEFMVPAGKHAIRIVNFALYDGVWEEHTIANNYSVDAVYEREWNFKKKASFALTMDLDKGSTVVKEK